ncbi:hypothetical protein NFI96_021747 [Prochilodus magdalenae]|nr:hypothetical protein NFI96_021747 [Prochilodus magdalenae]
MGSSSTADHRDWAVAQLQHIIHIGAMTEGIISLTRPSNTSLRVTQPMTTVMKRSTTLQTKLPQLKCCAGRIVLTASKQAMALDTAMQEHSTSIDLKRACSYNSEEVMNVSGEGTSSSPQENSLNHAHHSANSHSLPSKCSEMPREPADDWSEHISSSGKKYYYNCRTEVSQWEKPKEWLEREQRQKEASKAVVVNNFPKDRDYRQEAMQAATASTITEPTPSDKPSSHSNFSQASSSASGGLHTPGASTSSTSATVSPALQSHASALLQDPALLRQLLPALQATLQINNSNVDMAKINEAQQSGQSPMSVTPDASSPRSYVSPRVSTPQTNTVTQKPLHNAGSMPAQAKNFTFISPSCRFPYSSQGPPSSGPNGCLVTSVSSASMCPPTTFTPSLALHFNESLIRHVQSWPTDHIEKQASRLREEFHTMGSINMSEICTELKKLRSLVRVCEIQATLREQRLGNPLRRSLGCGMGNRLWKGSGIGFCVQWMDSGGTSSPRQECGRKTILIDGDGPSLNVW